MNALQTIRTRMSKLRRDQRGLSTVEYVIILVLIAAVCVATWTAFGKKLKGWLAEGEGTIDKDISSADKASGIK
jgi:Flp pilus assembly pilin Flp